jgi:hypothetical protein
MPRSHHFGDRCLSVPLPVILFWRSSLPKISNHALGDENEKHSSEKKQHELI